MTAIMAGKRVPVAEDEYVIARHLADDLQDVGADVLGPVATVADALALVVAERLAAAVLDVDPRGEMAYPVVDALVGRHVRIVPCTGYSASALPSRYAGVPRCEKPVEIDRLVAASFPG